MVFRVYVEKRREYSNEARSLYGDIKNLLGIQSLTGIRLLNRYDVEGITEELFNNTINTVFSEPQVDSVYYELPEDDSYVFAVEYLPGQFDQRADSAEQCIQIISCDIRPKVHSAKVYLVYGDISDSEKNRIRS